MAEPTLRKLDQPVHERVHFRRMASHPVLVGGVEQLIGSVAKLVHQDNFYFDPDK
ncbi:MAG: hypothetical protein QF569_08675 [Candidatus Poribacteria bacterium]|nr:hypothetical protein [Candidatus Poribacteria bacterium]